MGNDYEEIRNLCYRYTFLLDVGDFSAVGSLLAHATLQPVMAGVRGEEVRGAQAIEAFYSTQVVTYRDGDPRTRHLITNQFIELNSDGLSASSRCYFTVLQRPPKLPYQIVVGGQYYDDFDKVSGAWRFAKKAIQVDHLNEIQHHFLIAPDRRQSR